MFTELDFTKNRLFELKNRLFKIKIIYRLKICVFVSVISCALPFALVATIIYYINGRQKLLG